MIVTGRHGSKRSPWPPVRDLRIFFGNDEGREVVALDLSETGARLVSQVELHRVGLGEVCRLTGTSEAGPFSVGCLIMRRGEPPDGMSGVEIGVEFVDPPPRR